jgi:membrane-associated phospholipid phosphatase
MTGAAAKRAPSWPRWVRANVAGALAMLLRTPRSAVRPPWFSAVRLGAVTLATAAVVGLLMVFVDASAIAAARRLPVWVFAVFDEITDFGRSGWFLIPLGVILLAIAALAAPTLPHFTRLVLAVVAVRCGFLFMAIAVPSLFVTVVKRLVGRARPYVGSHGDPFLYAPLMWNSNYASLPSGHATTAFAALVAIGALWPRLRALMWAYALVIAASRVVVLAHHPSDVVAGAAVGAVGAWLVCDWFAARRLGFAISADGRVHALAGPSFARIKRVAGRLLAP